MDTNESITLGDVEEYIENKGESVYPSVAPKLVNGDIMMVWQQDLYAGSEIKEQSVSMCQNESSAYFFRMTADQIGVYNNTNEVCQGLWVGISNEVVSGMKMYPNPASESVNVTFSSEESANAVISVMNLMGQTVYTKNVAVNEGYNMVTLPVNQLRAGVYMVSLRTDKGISTQKLIVK